MLSLWYSSRQTGCLTGTSAGAEEGEPGDVDLEAAFDLGKKKKKSKKKALKLDDDEEGDDANGDNGASESAATGGVVSYITDTSGEKDYSYDELLSRVYGILREHNPELTGEKRRTVLKPPQVAREGTKKTVFTNFPEIAKQLNRSHDHIIAFILAELGTSGSLDGTQRLVVRGRFLPRAFENVLRRYMIEYVMCSSCKSPDTQLDRSVVLNIYDESWFGWFGATRDFAFSRKRTYVGLFWIPYPPIFPFFIYNVHVRREQATRLMYLRCHQCGASRSVAPIKAGFSARTTSRRSEQK